MRKLGFKIIQGTDTQIFVDIRDHDIKQQRIFAFVGHTDCPIFRIGLQHLEPRRFQGDTHLFANTGIVFHE